MSLKPVLRSGCFAWACFAVLMIACSRHESDRPMMGSAQMHEEQRNDPAAQAFGTFRERAAKPLHLSAPGAEKSEKKGSAESSPVIEFATKEAGAARIVIEAEDGKLQPRMTVRQHPKASGGKFIESPEGPDHKEIDKTGSATITFKVEKEGEYVLWARVGWCCSCGDSLDISIDGGERINFTSGTHGYHWHWLAAKKIVGGKITKLLFKLAPGEHILSVYNREDGSGLDQLLLTTDHEYVPTGIEKP